MPSASVLHLLTAPPQATAPDPGTVISATTPANGILTTSLLDPAVPALGATQAVREVKYATITATANLVYARFLTRPLPAQTIGAGNWKLAAVFRQLGNMAGSTLTAGLCVAQWRPGTSAVVARLLDNVSAGTAYTLAAGNDIATLTTVAGSSATLVLGDCLIVEVWLHVVPSGTPPYDIALLLGGLGQYVAGLFTASLLTDTDAVLVAPAAITFT